MINSTLGGLIKDYRLQRGVSQLDIAFALGWKEPSRLSRIEQGKTERPPREIIDKIIHAIDLDEQEKNVLLLTGGYLPTEEEIIHIRKETDKFLQDLNYPATLLDFSWRTISHNSQIAKLYSVTSEQETVIYNYHPRFLDILFEQVTQQTKMSKVENREELKTAILNFKYAQRYRTKEKWYVAHIKQLMDNDLFRQLWVEVDIRNKLEGILGKFAEKRFVCPDDPNKQLHFYLFIVPVLKDPRFEMEILMPKDTETYSHYKKS